MRKRIELELAQLREGGQEATLVPCQSGSASGLCVIYLGVPTAGADFNLPTTADVVVPVPSGYPGSTIDLAGFREKSPFLGKVEGNIDAHGFLVTEGQRWQLVSYHPHTGAGGPPWDQMSHGFHTYFTELVIWLAKLKK